MSERWFDDLPEHDPDDPEAVERALRRQERSARRQVEPLPEISEGESVLDRTAAARRPRTGGGSPRRRSPGRGAGGGSRKRMVLLAGAAVVGLAIVVFLFALFQPFAGDGDGDPVTINVPQGAGVGEIGDLLAGNGIISNATMFELRATISGKRSELYHGEHTFRENMSYAAALDELGRPPQKKTITVTIPEGLSRYEAADVIAASGLPGDYMKASIGSTLLDPDDFGAQGRAENLEGFLFPATYELEPGSDAQDLVDQQLEAFRQNIAGVNLKYARSKNLNVYDVLTIASMVEREVSVAKERPVVAAVIYNRLSRGEPLFIDATIRFAVDDWQEPLTESDLAVDSPYNTRTNQGLPPGPIGSPGLASIKASARPADTDVWLYVVKPGTCGEHVFSSSLDEHNRNVEIYQQAQEEAGGSPVDCG
jgi:UPF0755 protein